jgi:hypothetical protein
MLKHDTKKFILSRIRDNRVFSAILVCECIFLIILAANSCGAPFSVTIPADHLTSTQADRLSYSGTGISVDSTGSGDTVLILSSSKYRVPSGAYSVKVSYTARGSETTAGNSDTGYISASSEKYTSRVHCGSIPLRFDRTMQSQQLWIPYGCAVSDLVFNVYYNHLGTLSLTSVSLTEYASWRAMRFLRFPSYICGRRSCVPAAVSARLVRSGAEGLLFHWQLSSCCPHSRICATFCTTDMTCGSIWNA